MKFSVVTITYNSEATLKETLDSVLGQVYRPLQYVIVDGGSTDSTLSLVLEYESKFEEAGIEFSWISEPDKGISDAFNKGIERSNGDVIGIINSDDKLGENALEMISEAYDPKVNVYYGNCEIFGESRVPYIATPRFLKNKRLIEIGMPIFHPACFISSNTYKKFGMYGLEYKYCMDRELLLRIYRGDGVFKYIDNTLAAYREGGVNQANSEKCSEENMAISIKYGMSKPKAYIRWLFLREKNTLWRFAKGLTQKMRHN